MKYLSSIFVWLWWLWIATIPLDLHEIFAEVSTALGCQKGECYPDPPWASPFASLDWMETKTALLLWPVCIWFLVLRPLWKLEAWIWGAKEPAPEDKGNGSASKL
ncbi:hypothetical protein GCM10027034_14130 [Ramlibacter solisilvae]|uniref:hypothetical protein n=1 Tax=Ramlibacter tataouinensis TaxID=94132 RepID=UPI0011AE9CF8|nr:hypothetical protein [Ramlibacter tataouinensis]